MIVETPQILWHSSEDGKAAPLYSISAIDADDDDDDNNRCPESNFSSVMATGGNTSKVNLWRVTFRRGGAAGGG